MAHTPPTRRASRIAHQILPWLIASLLLGYLTRPYLRDPAARSALFDAFSKAGFGTFALTPALFLLIMFADSYAIGTTFRSFGIPLPFRASLLIRGSTYLLAILNYGVGQGGIVYFVHREHKTPVGRATGVVLFIMGINFVILLVLSTAGMLATPAAPEMRGLRLLVFGIASLLPAYALLLLLKPRFLASKAFLSPLFEAHYKGHFIALLLRFPHVAALLFSNYVIFRCFDVAPPIGVYLRDMPMVFFMAVLPITPQGLGTNQMVQIYFFARYGAGDPVAQRAAVFAASLFWTFCGLALNALAGAICLRLGGRVLLGKPKSA